MTIRTVHSLASLLAFALPASAGPYGGAADGVSADDPRIVGWATSVVELIRGPQDLADPAGPLASFGEPAGALGPADAADDFTQVVSLGDGGTITVSFAEPIADLEGPDFAVFENPFEFGGQLFSELAFVEVTSDGVNFFRFDAVSLTQTSVQLGAFDGIDPTDIHNLAGKNLTDVGTPFDLAELAGASPLLDLNAVMQVRLIDVVGSIDPVLGTLDSLGNPINNPYPTLGAGSGFDLDAVAVLRPIPEPGGVLLLVSAAAAGFSTRRKG